MCGMVNTLDALQHYSLNSTLVAHKIAIQTYLMEEIKVCSNLLNCFSRHSYLFAITATKNKKHYISKLIT